MRLPSWLTGIALAMLLVITAPGCGASSAPSRLLSDSPPLSRTEATSLAMKLSPMAVVDEVDQTPPGPRMWVVYGRDAGNRRMAVWVRTAEAVEGSVMLEQRLTAADAVAAVRAAGLKVLNTPPVLVTPSHPAWYVFVLSNKNEQGFALVDLLSGEVHVQVPTP